MDRDQIGWNPKGAAGMTAAPIPNTIAAKVEAITSLVQRCNSLAAEAEMRLRGPMPETGAQAALRAPEMTSGLLDDLERIYDRLIQLERKLEGNLSAIG